ncbi:hypothetical protein, partial [Escherichia coli]|uniref:hypothetical protein n=1 Tax=Escherichia coli TaxID=562 RepID=UPI001FF4D9B7
HNKHHQILLLLALLEAQQKTPTPPLQLRNQNFLYFAKKNTKNNKHSEHNERLQMIIIVRIKNTAI